MRIVFVTHPEVMIDPQVPVPDWALSPVGLERMADFSTREDLASVGRIHSSDERKAKDGAQILGRRLGLPVTLDPRLGENDRSSTGYVAPPRFWEIVERFFAEPEASVLGWERACDAQRRIVGAVRDIASKAGKASRNAEPMSAPDICIVAHGSVGTLLLCDLLGEPISNHHGQPAAGGGCFFAFDASAWTLEHGWRNITD